MIKTYQNGNYKVIMFDDGTKVRQCPDNEDFTPTFSENTDVCITKYCDAGCAFCYEGCSLNGKHADLFSPDYHPLLDSLHPYTEMALNGNDLSHPQLDEFLVFLKEKKVYANLTVNQIHFERHYDKIKEYVDNKLIYGLGVSLVNPTQEFIKKIKPFKNAVIHVINGILKLSDIDALRGHGLKILILGYKSLKRGVSYQEKHSEEIQERMNILEKLLRSILHSSVETHESWFKVISFDNLALEQLHLPFDTMDKEEWEKQYMGDDGKYTFYIDLVDGTYAKNSVSHFRYPINGKTIDEMFQHISGQKPYEGVVYIDYVLQENCPTVGNFNGEILNKKVKQEYIKL
jgi:hypothetical protein